VHTGTSVPRRDMFASASIGSLFLLLLLTGFSVRANLPAAACDPALANMYVSAAKPCVWAVESITVVDGKWSGDDKKALDKALDALIKAIDSAPTGPIAGPVGLVKKAIDALGPGGDVIEKVLVIYACTDNTGTVHRKTFLVGATDVDMWGAKAVKYGGKDAQDKRDRVIEKNRPKGSCCTVVTAPATGTAPTPTPTPTTKTGESKIKSPSGIRETFENGSFDPSKISGLVTVDLKSDRGDLKLRLPSDIRPGDTISGTIVDERSELKASDELSGAVVEVGGERAKIENGMLKFVVPEASELAFVVRDRSRKMIGKGSTVVNGMPSEDIITTGVSAVAQAGRPIPVTGSFDGNAANTQVSVGGRLVEIIAESPREIVFRLPNDQTPGATKIEINENRRTGNQITKLETNVVSVELTADKTKLLRGEKTTLYVKVTGLAGITSPGGIRLMLENGSPDVIRFNSTGENRLMKFVYSQVGPLPLVSTRDDFTMKETVTGLSSGSFIITATVFSVTNR
jgi:hypothetical protein